ncbi:MAG: hypothetical protein DRO01_03260 [Thermoproteota archaeon]|nr:MAG: hypothetical protein DRO01_03260 [Candidatus Korarchaeota archaeon]
MQSLRYTQPNSFGIVMPESYSNLPEKIYEEVTEAVNMAADVYRRMVALGVKKEDACYILPQGTKINLTYETNMQQLRHIISQRIAPGAHWEIRDVMEQVVSTCKKMDYIKDII